MRGQSFYPVASGIDGSGRAIPLECKGNACNSTIKQHDAAKFLVRCNVIMVDSMPEDEVHECDCSLGVLERPVISLEYQPRHAAMAELAKLPVQLATLLFRH